MFKFQNIFIFDINFLYRFRPLNLGPVQESALLSNLEMMSANGFEFHFDEDGMLLG